MFVWLVGDVVVRFLTCGAINLLRVVDELHRLSFLDRHDFAHFVLVETNAKERVGVLGELLFERGGDKLRLATLRANQIGDGCAIVGVERSVHFVKQIERIRITALNGKHECQRDERLLSARQLLYVYSFCAFCKRHANANARVSTDTRRVACRTTRHTLRRRILRNQKTPIFKSTTEQDGIKIF